MNNGTKSKNCLFLFAHNRPRILSGSLNSLIKSSIDKKIVVLLDNPQEGVVQVVENFKQSNPQIEIDVLNNPRLNGNIMAYIYKKIYESDLEVAGILETDYIFRPQYLEEVAEVFNGFPNTLSICGYHHPDTRNTKLCFEYFAELTKGFFGKDISNREYMYKPFESFINNKKYLLQGVSNQTGCHFLNVKAFKSIFNNKIEDLIKSMTDLRAKHGFCDGKLSSTYQIFWENWAKEQNLDLSKNFPILDICDFSIANHYGGGGICVGGPEGTTAPWISSPTWENDSKIVNR
jgi:hypothetical protein